MQSRDNSRLDLATNLWVVTRQNVSHVWSMQDNWITTGQRLQTDLSVIWQLELTTHPNHEWLASAPYFDFSHSLSYPTINTLIPTKCKEFLERIFREKPQRTTRLIHPHSNTFDSPNSSTLTLSLVIPWEDLKLNPYLTTFKIVRRFLVFGKQFKREPIHFGWCNELIPGSDKLKKIRLGLIMLEQKAWRA